MFAPTQGTHHYGFCRTCWKVTTSWYFDKPMEALLLDHVSFVDSNELDAPNCLENTGRGYSLDILVRRIMKAMAPQKTIIAAE